MQAKYLRLSSAVAVYLCYKPHPSCRTHLLAPLCGVATESDIRAAMVEAIRAAHDAGSDQDPVPAPSNVSPRRLSVQHAPVALDNSSYPPQRLDHCSNLPWPPDNLINQPQHALTSHESPNHSHFRPVPWSDVHASPLPPCPFNPAPAFLPTPMIPPAPRSRLVKRNHELRYAPYQINMTTPPAALQQPLAPQYPLVVPPKRAPYIQQLTHSPPGDAPSQSADPLTLGT
jgi:hypothetical protein